MPLQKPPVLSWPSCC